MSGIQKLIGVAVIALLAVLGGFNQMFVYNEAGYQTHIRTIGGTESVVSDIGYHWKGFGSSTAWKQAQTVQFVTGAQIDGEDTSGAVQDYRIVFLGNVDGVVEASTRFRLPQGEQFLKIAQEYRTPENFIATALTPAIKETLRDQIEQTTKAETEKKLAIISAEREKQSAQIAKLTSQELLDKAKIDAQATKVAADAEAYAKQAVIEADGALDKKLAAYVEVQKAFADAYAIAPVPGINMGGNGEASGRGGEAQDFLSLLTAKAAKDLQLDMNIKR